MKATLTIEVPDDWKKGNPDKCFLSEFTLDGCFDICKITTGRCNKNYCPLEIQDECNTNEYYADCKTCKRRYKCQEWAGSDTCHFEPLGRFIGE